MTLEVTPDGLRQVQFRSTFRGHDPAQVEQVLRAAALKLEQIDAERRKLASQLEESAGHRDLEGEFESIGREVAAILQSAREAADTMRERATVDAARWRSEAMEEADTVRRDAAADAEAMRRDAWVTSSDLLDQSATKSEALRANAERDVLTVMGEAEREAHRLTSAARREAEDLVRNASMDAERITAEAVKRRDEIIDGANRQAATAQERTRALEQRRDELLDELENVRSTLTRLEGSLEERREALDLTSMEPSSVRVVHPPTDVEQHWELGETVRVVPPDDLRGKDPTDIAEELTPPVVARAPEPEVAPVIEPEPEPAPEKAPEQEPQPETRDEPPPVAESPEAGNDDLDALFAALRGGGDSPPTDVAAAESPSGPSPVAPQPPTETDDGVDWIEVRESKLLPITNRALRGVKKAMTEVQNVALDSLRTEEDWRPDDGAIAEAVHAELVAVWAESFAAGHTVAEQMSGGRLKRPTTPASKADREFATDLAVAVSGALEKAGTGPRERQSAASRVFRVWRSDEAERRIRDIALRGYEIGIEKSRKVDSEV